VGFDLADGYLADNPLNARHWHFAFPSFERDLR
jgi:hypothetical protein